MKSEIQMPTSTEPLPDPYRVGSSSNPTNDSDRDLYTIPNYSSWFSWDEIHHNEKKAHSEFFNNASISKSPKIYKEYRDFIINKYREDPSRRLTFTDVRKSLIGDVGSIHNIFRFLENWGLINFGAGDDHHHPTAEDEMGQRQPKVVVEEGAPSGIRVVEFPNSAKVLAAAASEVAEGGYEEAGEGCCGFRMPPLTSYSDVFGEVGRKKGCWNCGADCVSGYYQSVKGGSVICAECFKNENYEESKLADDFKFIDVDGTGNHASDVWTDAETLLLLEAVTKHGDDWNLVEQHVRTKKKLDCISRLIQLPFGEQMLRTTVVKGDDRKSVSHTSDVKQMENTSVAEPQEPLKNEDQHHEAEAEAAGEIKDGDTEGPPLKRRYVPSFADAGSSLMKQVALLSTLVGPNVAAAAAEAAVAALCNENSCARKFFEAEEDNITYDLGSPTLNNEPERVTEGEDTEMEVKHEQSDPLEATPEKSGPSTLQIRVAIATAFGAAAAHAKLLADQEDREIEHLMATVIETQLKKIQSKIKHFEELESIMEKEYSHIQKQKESILADRIDVLQRAFSAGISRSRDHNFKSLTACLL